MSADIIEDASVLLPLGSNRLEEADILARADLRELLTKSAAALRAVKPKDVP